jgi:valyl-tRNA synthetase
MEINYDKWRDQWKESGLFKFRETDEKAPLFTIDTPPPFTSGDLHMGQVFWVIYIDAIARYYKMKGYNVLYPVGWDMQGFPTEMQAEKKYGKGLSREEFYERCTEIAKANMEAMKKTTST